MHTLTVDHASQDNSTRHRFHRGYHLWADLAENPICWAFGHRPTVYRLPLKYSHADGQDEYRWVECRLCGRRSDRQVPPAPTVVNFEGIARDVATRTGWAGRNLQLSAEVVVPRRPRPELSARFHLGGRGSETPVDAHLTVCGAGVYLSTSAAARLAERLTGGASKDLSLAIHGGTAYWKAWVGEDYTFDNRERWKTGKYRPWLGRDGNVSVNALDYLYGGGAKFSYTDIEDPVQALVRTTAGTEHTVTFTLQRQSLGRPRGPRKISYVADWSCEEGIPVRIDDWKGACYYSSAVKVPSPDGDWLVLAVAALIADVDRDREHYGWRPRATEDAVS